MTSPVTTLRKVQSHVQFASTTLVLLQAGARMNQSGIRDVWAGTLEQEFAIIRRTIIDFPLVGLVRMSWFAFSLELVNEHSMYNDPLNHRT